MKRLVKITSFALLALTMLSACGNKSGGGSKGKTVATTGLTADCTNCSGVKTNLMMRGAIKNATQTLVGQVELYGEKVAMDRARAASNQTGNQSPPIVFYGGPVILAGEFAVSTPVYLGSCVIPPGTYQVRTIQMGTMQATVFGNMDLIFDGPRDLRVRLRMGEPWQNYQRLMLDIVGLEGPQGYNPGVMGPCGGLEMVLN